jgi:hypothetical protein
MLDTLDTVNGRRREVKQATIRRDMPSSMNV